MILLIDLFFPYLASSLSVKSGDANGFRKDLDFHRMKQRKEGIFLFAGRFWGWMRCCAVMSMAGG